MKADRGHPDWNELAALADAGADGARPELLRHLAVCPACLSAWSAALEQRDRDLADADAGAGAARPRVVAMRGRKPRIAQVAGGRGGIAVAALLLLALLPREPALLGSSVAEQRLLQRLGGLSHTGLFYPRVVALSAAPLADYRAGATNGSGPDLSVWAERFAADAGDGEAAFWLASGHLARGQIDLAEDVLRRALRRSPRSLELRHLAAIAAYQRSDLAAAAAELQAILREHPDQPLARLNLAVIDLESGRIDEARPALEALATGGSPAAVRERALRLLAGIGLPRP